MRVESLFNNDISQLIYLNHRQTSFDGFSLSTYCAKGGDHQTLGSTVYIYAYANDPVFSMACMNTCMFSKKILLKIHPSTLKHGNGDFSLNSNTIQR